MTIVQPSQKTVMDAANRLQAHFDQIMRPPIPQQLVNLWKSEWSAELERVRIENRRKPEVVISLVGGTGSGKSTLLNALLGNRILPVSNMRSCTAAIAEVRYAEQNAYTVQIEFLSRAAWTQEMRLLLEEVQDSGLPADASDGDGAEVQEISRAAKDKLQAVYQIPPEVVLTKDVLASLQEPPAISEALSRGSIQFTCDSLDLVRGQVSDYLDAKKEFWPIVQRVCIRGPFELLKCGAVIVDLPGINDANEAREQVTRNYLKQCRYLWIVFNIKRALTRDLKDVLHSEDFARQIVMDGREGALTLVGTASDDFDVDSAIDELSLSLDSSEPQIAAARNDTVRTRVHRELDGYVQGIISNAKDATWLRTITEALLRTKVFTVSSLEYLRLTGHSKKRTALLDNVEQTEIPQLRQHISDICSAFGAEAQARSHHRQLVFLLQRISTSYLQARNSIQQDMKLTDKKRKEMCEAMDRLASFLGRSMEEHRERFSMSLDQSQKVLSERLSRAVERGRMNLTYVCSGWSGIHWATLRAIARRGGSYKSPTSGHHDLPAQVAKPILDGIAFGWSEFFGNELKTVLKTATERLLAHAEKHGREVLAAAAQILAHEQAALHDDLRKTLEMSERIVREHVEQVSQRIEHRISEVRRELYESIPKQIEANMQAAFLAASQEHGTGMKGRMVTALHTRASDVSDEMFESAEEEIMAGVRALQNWLQERFKEIADVVRRHYDVHQQNLLGKDKIPIEQLQIQLQEVEGAASALEDLRIAPELLVGSESITPFGLPLDAEAVGVTETAA